MSFSSLTFTTLIFPIIVIALYFIKSKKQVLKLIYLVSLILYFIYSPYDFLLLIVVAVFTYFIGRYVYLNKKLLSISIIVLILYLAFFKYNSLNIKMPLGVSFYIFTCIAYLCDGYKNKFDTNLKQFLTFIFYFPTVISGPILRYKNFVDYVNCDNSYSNSNLVSGFNLFTFGLFKKVIIANNLALICNEVFNTTYSYSFITLWIGVVCYTLQIYFDFSGYSQMAMGISKIFGFDLPINFNNPLLATSIKDFWKKWHISLSSWFKDYIYIPLGGNRKSIIITIRNLFIVWLITGLWHGNTNIFILWGLYNFLLVCIETYIFKIKINKFISIAVTFFITCLGFLIFRSTSITELNEILSILFSLSLGFGIVQLKQLAIFYLFPYILIGFVVLILEYKNIFKFKKFYLYLLLFIACIIYIINSSNVSFIYFGF